MAGDIEITDEMVEAASIQICRSHPNYGLYHMPGDTPRKWRSPGGAIFETNALSDRAAETVRISARAAISAVYPLIAKAAKAEAREACAVELEQLGEWPEKRRWINRAEAAAAIRSMEAE